MKADQRLIVAISGASGVILGIRLLQMLRALTFETHLILSPAAKLTIRAETEWQVEEVVKLAHVCYSHRD
ncbi:MAG: flavoprotein, partial [Anaerolineales bacterium]|nr:hypothetical protein [Anaerolineales bacterium]MDW8447658.1 flavoprotein [Anaerolineales bacterium]